MAKRKLENVDECSICSDGGMLVCCDYCPKSYHLECLGLEESTLPEGKWQCPHHRKGKGRAVADESEYVVTESEYVVTESESSDDDQESLTAVQQQSTALPTEEQPEEQPEDPFTIHYFCEYGANNRSKCKSCGVKLKKGDIRFGIRANHSKYGIHTYYKVRLRLFQNS